MGQRGSVVLQRQCVMRSGRGRGESHWVCWRLWGSRGSVEAAGWTHAAVDGCRISNSTGVSMSSEEWGLRENVDWGVVEGPWDGVEALLESVLSTTPSQEGLDGFRCYALILGGVPGGAVLTRLRCV